MRVLHITECHEGGVSRAIRSIVENSPENEHFLLYKGLDEPTSDFRETHRVTHSAVRFDQWRRDIAQAVKSLRPEVIHAHSSWAGLSARIAPLPVPVVYQPHCFAFDMHTPLAFGYRMVERLVAGNTAAFLTLSAHEAAQARELSPSTPVFVLPNVSTIPLPADAHHSPAESSETSEPVQPRIVMVGRLCEQKAPETFAQIRAAAPPHWRFTWIGDGDEESRRHLENSGIEVTGWLDAAQLADRLRSASAYAHTAAWEGFPLSVLDADACGLPIVARNIPAFDSTGIPVFTTPAEAVELLETALQLTRPEPGSQLPGMNPQAQRDVLSAVYDAAVHRGSARVDS